MTPATSVLSALEMSYMHDSNGGGGWFRMPATWAHLFFNASCAVALLACQEVGDTPEGGAGIATGGGGRELSGGSATGTPDEGGSGAMAGLDGSAMTSDAGPGQSGDGATTGGGAMLPGTGHEPGVVAPDCKALPPTTTAGVIVNDKACWFPFNMPWDDDSPNVTNMKRLLDAPAGKHGYLKVAADGHFYFEDQPGVRARFNGVTITAGANFPDKALAPGIAARMARFGINMVRVTFEDYIPPFGLFKQPLTTTRDFDPVQLDKLDWFLYELKLHGIYVHLDFLSARPFLTGDGVPNQLTTLGQKIGTLFDPTLVDLQREFIEKLLTHVNPYTKLAYKADPAIPLAILANENALFLGWVAWMPDKAFYSPSCGDCLSAYYSTELDNLYNAWLKTKYGTDDAIRAAWGSLGAGETLASSSIARTPRANFGSASKARIRDDARFYYDTEGKYLSQLRSYIKDTLGSHMLVTMTTQEFGVASVASQAQGDFLDNNIYWHHPSSLERTPGKYFGFYDAPVVANMSDSQNFITRINQGRVKGLPVIVSEFNYNFPCSYQMEAPGLMYAFLNFVGGDGVLWHAYYNFSARTDAADLNDMFEVGASPHLITQFLLAKPYLAGDLKEPAAFAQVVQSEQDLWDTVWKAGSDKIITSNGPPLTSLLKTPMARSFFGNATTVPPSLVDPGNDFITGNGELHWNNTKGLLTINNAHWQGAIGFFKDNVQLDLLDLRGINTTGGRDFASINLVAMDDQPLSTSNQLVLTTVARAENTGQTWNPPKQRPGNTPESSLHDLGGAPVLLEPVRGRVGIKLDALDKVEVWALDPRGNGLQRVATEVADGKLWFDLGHATLWYQIGRRN